MIYYSDYCTLYNNKYDYLHHIIIHKLRLVHNFALHSLIKCGHTQATLIQSIALVLWHLKQIVSVQVMLGNSVPSWLNFKFVPTSTATNQALA